MVVKAIEHHATKKLTFNANFVICYCTVVFPFFHPYLEKPLKQGSNLMCSSPLPYVYLYFSHYSANQAIEQKLRC